MNGTFYHSQNVETKAADKIIRFITRTIVV